MDPVIPPEELAAIQARIVDLASHLGYRSAAGLIEHGALSAVARHLGCSRATVHAAWVGRRRLPASAWAGRTS